MNRRSVILSMLVCPDVPRAACGTGFASQIGAEAGEVQGAGIGACADTGGIGLQAIVVPPSVRAEAVKLAHPEHVGQLVQVK